MREAGNANEFLHPSNESVRARKVNHRQNLKREIVRTTIYSEFHPRDIESLAVASNGFEDVAGARGEQRAPCPASAAALEVFCVSFRIMPCTNFCIIRHYDINKVRYDGVIDSGGEII